MGKINKEMKYGYSDVTIIPKPFTHVRHRGECNPFIDNIKTLPIFAAPMSQIVDCENYKFFENSGVIPILPRNIDFDKRIDCLNGGMWVAFGLDEMDKLINDFKSYVYYGNAIHLCLDLANGHMTSVLETCVKFKEKCKDGDVKCEIMTGNIANPKWVKMMNENYTPENSPIDYVRCSIGSGSMCITSTQTKIYFPSASLIEECVEANFNKAVKIIADGGIKGYADVVAAIGLGADYVMIGGLFAKSFEACGTLFHDDNFAFEYEHALPTNVYSDESFKKEIIEKYHPYRDYYGMASKKAQKEFGNFKNKTAEGKTSKVNVEYTLRGWIDNMISYLRSAMSYTDSFTLDDFRNNAEFVVNSQGAVNSVNK